MAYTAIPTLTKVPSAITKAPSTINSAPSATVTDFPAKHSSGGLTTNVITVNNANNKIVINDANNKVQVGA